MNARGQITQSILGNNILTYNQTYSSLGFLQSQSIGPVAFTYTFEPTTGNLMNRKGHNQYQEDFIYDNLDRLTLAAHYTSQQGIVEMSADYAPNGNIISKFNTGDYQYGGTGPHALSSVQNLTAGAYPTAQQDIQYTFFNKAKLITEGAYTATLTYGPDEQRRKMTITGGANTITKYYVGDYEKIIIGNTIRELHYTNNAVFVRNTIGSTVLDSIYYIHTDHLGSIATVFKQDGSIAAKYSYDVWGRRRNWNDFTYTLTGLYNQNIFDRFYTGHESIPLIGGTGGGLINMNGRMYDPFLGRMLSPDNYASTISTQTFNRYAYAFNNPLKYTDPTGNWAGWDDVIVGGVGFAFGYVSYGIKTGDWGWSAVGSGVLSAGMFMLGYYTAGAGTASYGSIAGGFSAAGLQGSANTVALSYAGQMVATSAISSFMPPITVPIGDNASVSVSPAISFSPSGFSAGMNISATYTNGDFVGSAGYGVNNSGYRLSGGLSYHDRANDQYFSGYMSYDGGGSDNQTIWQAGWAKNEWSATINEDYLFSDKYRTFAAEIGHGNYSLGTSLYTTTHSSVEGASVDYNTSKMFPNQRQYQTGERTYSGLYIGYKNGNTINRAGIDAPFVNDLFQGGYHSVFNVPLFDSGYGPGSTRPYYYSGYHDPFSLYGR